DVVSQAIYGANVHTLERQPGWLKIRTADDYQGWAPADSLLPVERPYGSSECLVQVESLFASLYREPDVRKQAPLLTVPYETRLEVIRQQDERWIQVRLPDDRPAWVQRGDVTFDPRPLGIEESIALAKRFLGLPYFWGGASSFGFDCSGFTQMLYRRRGTGIPRDTGPQAAWEGFAPVERTELRPGDLIFFGDEPPKISHTGMYIGEGRFVHASTHERPVVQIGEVSDPHWTVRFACARRLK
ncbi:MAG: NlpC/P60 family protein, partial [Acidobacteria bacterium]|nr:NlpC/P60 family protein [Acidobacteriota bacterium]